MGADSTMPSELHWKLVNSGLPCETNTATDDAVTHTPLDPLWPSGVCSVIIHHVNLEPENIEGSQGNRKGREYEPAKPSGENKEGTGGHLPTSYSTISFQR